MNALLKFNHTVSACFDVEAFGDSSCHSEYLRLGSLLLALPSTRIVADIACGSSWHFPSSYKQLFDVEVHGYDIDGRALDENHSLDQRFCSDVSRLPLEPNAYDLITSYSGLEHFEDNHLFLENAYEALRPGGRAILQFPSNRAAFAVLNRILPRAFTQRLIAVFAREKTDEIGYPAFYDRTAPSQFKKLACQVGFEVEYFHPYYFSAGYFKGAFPIYFAILMLEFARALVGGKNQAAYCLFILKKPGASEHLKLTWT